MKLYSDSNPMIIKYLFICNSNSSQVNIEKCESFIRKGLMQPAGLKSFEARSEKRSRVYTHENDIIDFPPNYLRQFKANKPAWKYFQALAPSYKKLSGNWVMTAKQKTTHQKKLLQLIEDSAAGTNQWKDNKYKKKQFFSAKG